MTKHKRKVEFFMKNVKDIIIDFDDYYINQGASSFANIKFKNGTTVGKYGCGVCCAAMIICREKGLTSNTDKANVIKKVIADSTNNNGDLNYNTITYDGTSFNYYADKTPKENQARDFGWTSPLKNSYIDITISRNLLDKFLYNE
jgi:hypothetical protein